VIISSINPHTIQSQLVIAGFMTEVEKHLIVHQLESESTIQGVSTDLAIQVGEQQNAAEIPKEYQEFAQVYNDEASQ
jgi:hypothetical protein